jgi:hypothetical protein
MCSGAPRVADTTEGGLAADEPAHLSGRLRTARVERRAALARTALL